MNREQVKELMAVVKSALPDIESKLKFPVKLTLSRTTWDDSNGKMSITFSNVASDGTIVSKERTDFIRFCGRFGLEPDDLDSTVDLDGTKYKIIGLRIRARKTPITIQRISDGKSFVAGESYIHRGLGRSVQDVESLKDHTREREWEARVS